MKLLLLLLGLSLAANAAFIVLTAQMRSDAPPANLRAVERAVPPANPAASFAATEPDTAVWEHLQSDELPTLVTRLRAAGFPPHLLRAIVLAQIDQQFAARRAALVEEHPLPEFWRGGGARMNPKFNAAMRQMGVERAALARALLGSDADKLDAYTLAMRQRRYGDLPPEKIEQIEKVSSDYSDLRAEIQAAADGLMLPEDREKLRFLKEEERADLASVLTPEELREYELRSSETAFQLSYQLVGFQPTEQEFRAIFEARQAVENQIDPGGSGSRSSEANRLREAMLAQLEGQLPPERLAELEQAIDPTYQNINRILARFGLPMSSGREVVAVQKDVAARASKLRSDPGLSSAARDAQLAALHEEAMSKLTATLGERALAAYQTYSGGWLRHLAGSPASKGR